MQNEPEYLNIAHYASGIKVLGPGERIVVWVQGCKQQCPECVEPAWRPLVPAVMVTIDDFARYALSHPAASGITFSGGEPMLQARGLVSLWLKVKQERPAWTLITFTGYTSEHILAESDPWRVQLMNESDLLIAGPFIESLNDGKGLRGSTNQEFRFKDGAAFSSEEREQIVSGRRNHQFHAGENKLILAGVP